MSDSTQSELENQIATWVAELVKTHLGETPGRFTRQDGTKDPTLTVDFTFEESIPPFALEVTRVRADFEDPDKAALERFGKRLTKKAKRLGWASWFVGIRPETQLKGALTTSTLDLIEVVLRLGLDELGPGTYTRDIPADLLARMNHRFFELCDQARLLGLVLLRKESAGDVQVLHVREFSDSNSLLRPLDRAMRQKAQTLSGCKQRGYWTMLAVDVEREDAQAELRPGVKVPGFPKDLDHLWLLVRREDGTGLGRAFYARRDARRLVEVSTAS
jgi:hypothetical protein